MLGVIVQAIDHARKRMQEGAGAGIKVANSQHGGGAPISNMDSGAGEVVKQDLRNQQDTTPEQKEAAEKAKIGSNSIPTGSEGVSKGVEAITGSEGASSEGIAEAASSILSDENAKTSNPVSSLQSMRAYGANVGKGFANAGAIATGNKATEWEDINNSFAKKAAEDTVKNWRKKDFNKQENASMAEEK